MMTLKYSPVNQAYFVLFCGTMIAIGEQFIFSTKTELRQVLFEHGLKLQSDNSIVSI